MSSFTSITNIFPTPCSTGDRGAPCRRRQVLILAPFRSSASAIVRRLWALAQAETRTDSVQHRERFLDDFGGGSDGDEGNKDVAAGGGGPRASHEPASAGTHAVSWRQLPSPGTFVHSRFSCLNSLKCTKAGHAHVYTSMTCFWPGALVTSPGAGSSDYEVRSIAAL